MMTELAGVKHGAPLAATMRIAGEPVGNDRTIEVRNPYTGALVGTVPKATVDDVRRAFAMARALSREAHALRARGDHAEGRGADPRARRRDLRPHHRRIRPVQEGHAVRGRPRVRRVHVRRQRGAAGRRPGVLVRPHAARQVAQGLHDARAAAGRHLRDHAVQPSAEPGGAQDRAVDRHQQPDGAEAHREDAAHRDPARRHPLRGGAAAADAVGRHRRSRARSPTRCWSTTTSTS